MTRRILLTATALILAACAGVALDAQTVTVSGCSTVAASNVAKSTDKVKLAADIACLDRAAPIASDQIAAARKVRQDRLDALTKIKVPPIKEPAPTPTPTPAAKPIDLFVGDSLSVFWSGNHTGIVAAATPAKDVRSEAVGGTGIADVNGARLAAILAMRPAEATMFFGANDLANPTLYPSEADWLAADFKLAAALKAAGVKVVVGTVLNQCNAVEHNRRAAIVNAAIRAQAPVLFAGVADYASDPVLSAPNAMCDPTISPDGVHLYDLTTPGKVDGQRRLAAIDMGAVFPVPTPTPSPSPTGGTTPSTSNGELDKVASGINVADFVQPTWGDGSIPAHEDDVGAFRFLCAPSKNAYNDPIVYPGQPGKSHLHTFFGNTLADANSTYTSLRTTGDSTCNNKLNRSAYWVAALMNGAGKVVMPDYLAVYYKRMTSTDVRCRTEATACVKLPRGLRYIFGFNMLNPASTPITEASKYQRWWNCDASPLGQDGVTANPGGHYGTIAEAMTANGGCKPGSRLGMVLVAPDCWNGKDLDSPDHRSHMAYRFYDGTRPDPVCPTDYPVIIPQFTLGVWYTVDATGPNWYLSSDRMPGMTPSEPGTTEHADWFGAWDDGILDTWTANCIEKLLSCSGGDLGNGQQLKTLFGYSYGNSTVLVDPPAAPMTM